MHLPAFIKVLTSIAFIFSLLIFLPEKTYALIYLQPGQSFTDSVTGQTYTNASATTECFHQPNIPDCKQTDNLNDCTTYGGKIKDNQCFQGVPDWTFKYASACTVCLGQREPDCAYNNYQYSFNSCGTGDRCEDPSVNNLTGQTGAGAGTGSNQTGRILPGICQESHYDGVNPNTACVSGNFYKQCCTPPNGTTPTSACLNGGCPNGDVPPPFRTTCAAATTCTVGQACTGTGGCQGTTTCPNGSTGSPVCTCPTPKYKCSGTACVRDDALGGFTTSNCDNRCGTCETAPTYSPPKNTSATAPGPCNPAATSCTAPCSDTCPIQGQTCPATSCVSVWGCQNGVQWYNSGTYYPSCPATCSAPGGGNQVCIPGSSQVLCDQTTCQVPPR